MQSIRACAVQTTDGSLHRLTADKGVEQGDAFAPALFAYGVRPALLRSQAHMDEICALRGLPSVSLFAYLDDIVIMAPPDLAEVALETVRAALTELCGLELSDDKTQVWTPRRVRPPGFLARHWCPDGVVILGGPVEAPTLSLALAQDALRPNAYPVGLPAGCFVQTFVAARLATMRQAAALLARLVASAPSDYPALQIALQLLVFCVAPKADHLLRHLPPSVGATLGTDVDQLLLEALQTTFGVQLSARQGAQAAFSLSEGGLGLRSRGGAHAAAAYLGSWALVYHRVASTLIWCLPECGPKGPSSLGKPFGTLHACAPTLAPTSRCGCRTPPGGRLRRPAQFPRSRASWAESSEASPACDGLQPRAPSRKLACTCTVAGARALLWRAIPLRSHCACPTTQFG